MNVTCGCVIPCYNEIRHVGFVLHALTQINALDEIICVDDGSSDGTARIIQDCFPQVTLLRLKNNQGKAAAVLRGARQAQSEFLLLVDADLQNIVIEEFSFAVTAIQQHPEMDMLILRRVKKDFLTRLLRGDITITGERIVRRVDLIRALEKDAVQGFQLEVALNQYMLDHGKSVRWSPISSTGVISLRKMGFWAGLKKEIRMFPSILGYIGLRKLILQSLLLGRRRLEIP